MSQRDTFIDTLFDKAVDDKDIYLISVDMGAPSLDRWRERLPDQFIAAGISEQNAINFAAGLSAAGKKVYVYFMASWAARCFEQIRYSCAMAGNSITILGNGVGLGYSPAGPAHNPTEDIAYMRSLCGLDIYCPCNDILTKELVNLTLQEPKLRYVRLERRNAPQTENQYSNSKLDIDFIKSGASVIKTSSGNSALPKVCILSSGYMLGRSLEAAESMILVGHQILVADIWRVKNINQTFIKETVKDYDILVTVEEQTLSGGFGSAILEVLSDLRIKKDVLRIGLPERYIFENGSRNHLIDNNGLSSRDIEKKIVNFMKKEQI
jgi:transketolase